MNVFKNHWILQGQIFICGSGTNPSEIPVMFSVQMSLMKQKDLNVAQCHDC